VAVAQGRARAYLSASRLTLKPRGAYRRTLLRARRTLKATLEAVVRGDTEPEQRATRRLVLRR
jgi:hypothetical protein